MMLARRFAEQLARPSGLGGRLLGAAMDLANRRPTRFALDLLDARPGESVLDAGCGTGAALAALLEDVPVRATGIDPSPAMIAAARRRLADRADLHQVPIEAMPFPDQSFDAVLALNVLYFADVAGGMVGQLHRVLKPGGRLIAYVTARDTMEDWSFAQAGFHRLYDHAELEQALLAGGFARDRIRVHDRAVTATIDGLIAVATKDG